MKFKHSPLKIILTRSLCLYMSSSRERQQEDESIRLAARGRPATGLCDHCYLHQKGRFWGWSSARLPAFPLREGTRAKPSRAHKSTHASHCLPEPKAKAFRWKHVSQPSSRKGALLRTARGLSKVKRRQGHGWRFKETDEWECLGDKESAGMWLSLGL